MGVLLATVIMVLFVAMGFGSDVDEVFEALRHPVTHGRHGSGELSVEALRARCQADTLPYYPAPKTAAKAETDATDRPPRLTCSPEPAVTLPLDIRSHGWGRRGDHGA